MRTIVNKLKIYGLRRFVVFAFMELKYRLITQLVYGSYSQNGEDVMLDQLLGYKKTGLYIDIGANDPHRFSNTKRFYKKGWTGINVEPDPTNYQKLIRDRVKDVNLNIGIGDVESRLSFYKFFPDTLSTFSKIDADKYVSQGYLLRNVVKVNVEKLETLFIKYCAKRVVDFITIDTEGFDMHVLRGNDWSKFRPAFICIESKEHESLGNTDKSNNQELFMNNVGYEKIYDNGLNSIYKQSNIHKYSDSPER